MRKIIGFALFFIAVGMFFSLFMESTFFTICMIILCLVLGFNLFCCGRIGR
ncbi:MAG: hypothetical protein K6G85_09075 [Eubacterium sp.]|nr:hypothetical protein [Eubacterium sp.]